MHSQKEMRMGVFEDGIEAGEAEAKRQTNLRDKMKKDAKATLLHEWDVDKSRYRLIARGDMTAGYEDQYIIEKLGSDSLGEPSWAVLHGWKPREVGGDQDTKNLLVSAIKSLSKSIP